MPSADDGRLDHGPATPPCGLRPSGLFEERCGRCWGVHAERHPIRGGREGSCGRRQHAGSRQRDDAVERLFRCLDVWLGALGRVPQLAKARNCPVYVHSEELRFAVADASTYFATYEPYSAGSRSWQPPRLDRGILLPTMRLLPQDRRESIIARESLKARARPLPRGGEVPALPGWQAIPTPGHTPGHVAFFRASDRLLIAGDALVTVQLNSPWGFALWAFGRSDTKLSGPPRFFTWSRQVVRPYGPNPCCVLHTLPRTPHYRKLEATPSVIRVTTS